MIVVTGATGNVGQPLVQALVDAGEEVRAVSRKATGMDLAKPESLKPALDGAEALFLLTSGDFLANGNIHDVMTVVREAGVRKVVLLSSQGVGTQRHPAHLEDAVKQSGLQWTMLRPGNFNSNTFLWTEMVRKKRVVAAPFADVALPAIDPADIAEVAARVLREAGHEGGIYTLTGPEPISPRQQAAAIGDAVGEVVRFVEESREEARARMLQFMPEPVVDVTLGILGAPSADEQAVSPDVERLLGRAPRSFADWAARNVAAFK